MESRLTRICVTGGSGRLAQALKPYFPFADYTTRQTLNVADAKSCRDYFSTHSVDVILHLAAETAHDSAHETYLANNVTGTTNIALWARRLNVRLVYTSTDYVYPGLGQSCESDPVLPIGCYAASKYAGEVSASMVTDHLVIRGSWYDRLDWSSAAVDAFSSRIPVAQAAGYVAALTCSGATGVVNVGGPRRSLYELIATEFNPRVSACSRGDLKLPYELPMDVSLDLSRLHALVGH